MGVVESRSEQTSAREVRRDALQRGNLKCIAEVSPISVSCCPEWTRGTRRDRGQRVAREWLASRRRASLARSR